MNMKYGAKEFWVGCFVLVGVLALIILSVRVGNFSSQDSGSSYNVSASFDDIGGLTVKSPVRMSGVTIGRVTSISIDPMDYSAIVSMQISGDHANLPLDSSAAVLTSGLLGSQYVGFEPGAEDDYLKEGDRLEFTQSAMVLEKLIGRFITSMGSK